MTTDRLNTPAPYGIADADGLTCDRFTTEADRDAALLTGEYGADARPAYVSAPAALPQLDDAPAPRRTPEATAIETAAFTLLHLLDTTVPASTVHYAVEDARRALLVLAREANAGIKTVAVDVPRLVVVESPEDGGPKVLRCTACDATGAEVIEVDRAERWNHAEPVIDPDGTIFLGYGTGQGDFDHHGYRCGACNAVVTLPDVKVDETWR